MYRDEHECPIADPEVLARLRALAIPPAWKDVWICPDAWGHLQATGVDAAGRKQYLYHERWRDQRDREKFDRMLAFGAALPGLRAVAADDLSGSELARERVLACAVRLLDLGFFRIGSEGYAEENGTYGLATLKRRHVTLGPACVVVFDYPAKRGQRRVQSVVDPKVYEIVAALRARRTGEQLLAYRVGRAWADVRATEVNEYIKACSGGDFSAKDFRTWKATVLMALSLAILGQCARSKTSRKRIVSLAVTEVARYLGNTPAVCRTSYVDPRVIDRFNAGITVAGTLESIEIAGDDPLPESLEAAVLDLVGGGSSVLKPGCGNGDGSKQPELRAD